MDFLQCMELRQAQELILKHVGMALRGSEQVELDAALGRVAADDLFAVEDIPAFARSSVDGFAVRSGDTFGASEGGASFLSVVGEVLMGQSASIPVGPGQAVAVPTGGMLPEGADSVVMLEYIEQPDPHSILVQRSAAPGENTIRRGEDMTNGAKIIDAGIRISSRHIGILAACGFTRIPAREKIKAAVLSSGDELIEIDRTPEIGQVRNVNSHALAALLQEMGCEVNRLGIVRDEQGLFLNILRTAVEQNDLVVISGGSSVGARDYSVSALEELCPAGVLVHGLAIKPGKPTIFGMAGKVPVFGLPGHPVAALTVCGELVRLAVRKMYGQTVSDDELKIPAVLTRNIPSAPGRDDFVSVRLIHRDNGLAAEPILGKSGLIGILARADGIIHVPSDKTGLYEGESVMVRPLARLER